MKQGEGQKADYFYQEPALFAVDSLNVQTLGESRYTGPYLSLAAPPQAF